MHHAVRRMRRAARRLQQPPRGLLRWTVLVSLLGHVVALVVLRLAPAPADPAPEPLVVSRWSSPPPPALVEPPPPPRRSPTKELEYVPARAPSARPARATDRISARDQRGASPPAPLPRPDPGADRQAQAVGAEAGGYQTRQRRVGQLGSRRGGVHRPLDAVARGRRGGGGHSGPASSEGTPRAGHDVAAGGQPSRGAHGGHRATQASAAVPRRADDAPWWKPVAVRIAPLAAPRRGADPEPLAPHPTGPTDGAHRGPRRRGAAPTRPTRSPPRPDPARPTPGTEQRPADEPLGDPIRELREALGFGPLDREQLAARPAWVGDHLADGAPSTAPARPDDLPAEFVAGVDARGTPLGRWIQRADERIRERWLAADLSAHDRAIGIQGEVTLRARVLANGRVDAVVVERSSGLPRLDALAASAIPPRLPRLPRSVADDGVYHRVTLRYRNPLVKVAP